MKKLIILAIISIVAIKGFSQTLSIIQLRSTLHKDASQITNFLTIKGWNYYKSVDSLEKKALMFTYGLQHYRSTDRANLWYEAFFSDGEIYAVRLSFGDNKEYSDIIKQLELLKVKITDQSIHPTDIELTYSDGYYYYKLKSISRNNELPFSLEIQTVIVKHDTPLITNK